VIIAFAMTNLVVAQQYEAVVELGQEMSPRYFWGSPRLAKRQLSCETGQHDCKLAFNVYL